MIAPVARDLAKLRDIDFKSSLCLLSRHEKTRRKNSIKKTIIRIKKKKKLTLVSEVRIVTN